MADGTTLNGVFAPRIHKSNAGSIKHESQGIVDRNTVELVMLAAHHPTADECEGLAAKVEELVESIIYNSSQYERAFYILENPDECVDDFDTPER